MRKKSICLVCWCSLFLLASVMSASAQSPAPLMMNIQDSIWISRVVEGDTIPGNSFSVAYDYEMRSDTNFTLFMFAHCRRNNLRLKLLNFVLNQTLKLNDSTMTEKSRTETFGLSEGDTLGFYRDLDWSSTNADSDTNNYRARDTLCFSVELVKASNGQRLVLLDTLGILPRSSPGIPVYFGIYGIMASPKYIVPSALNGDSGFIRVRVYSRGDGDYYFSRTDRFATGLFTKVTDTNSALAVFRDRFPGGFSKRVVDPDRVDWVKAYSLNKTNILTVTPNPSARDVSVVYNQPRDESIVKLSVFDLGGRNIELQPEKADELNDDLRKATFHFSNPGSYVVGLVRNGLLINSQLVIINH